MLSDNEIEASNLFNPFPNTISTILRAHGLINVSPNVYGFFVLLFLKQLHTFYGNICVQKGLNKIFHKNIYIFFLIDIMIG